METDLDMLSCSRRFSIFPMLAWAVGFEFQLHSRSAFVFKFEKTRLFMAEMLGQISHTLLGGVNGKYLRQEALYQGHTRVKFSAFCNIILIAPVIQKVLVAHVGNLKIL